MDVTRVGFDEIVDLDHRAGRRGGGGGGGHLKLTRRGIN